jgi:hypothetical protein
VPMKASTGSMCSSPADGCCCCCCCWPGGYGGIHGGVNLDPPEQCIQAPGLEHVLCTAWRNDNAGGLLWLFVSCCDAYGLCYDALTMQVIRLIAAGVIRYGYPGRCHVDCAAVTADLLAAAARLGRSQPKHTLCTPLKNYISCMQV